jgi:hypothetical protein
MDHQENLHPAASGNRPSNHLHPHDAEDWKAVIRITSSPGGSGSEARLLALAGGLGRSARWAEPSSSGADWAGAREMLHPEARKKHSADSVESALSDMLPIEWTGPHAHATRPSTEPLLKQVQTPPWSSTGVTTGSRRSQKGGAWRPASARAQFVELDSANHVLLEGLQPTAPGETARTFQLAASPASLGRRLNVRVSRCVPDSVSRVHP